MEFIVGMMIVLVAIYVLIVVEDKFNDADR